MIAMGNQGHKNVMVKSSKGAQWESKWVCGGLCGCGQDQGWSMPKERDDRGAEGWVALALATLVGVGEGSWEVWFAHAFGTVQYEPRRKRAGKATAKRVRYL